MLLKPFGFNHKAAAGGSFSAPVLTSSIVSITMPAGTTQTLTGVDMGAGGEMYVGIYIGPSSASLPTAVTVGGQTATAVGTLATISNRYTRFWRATGVPSGSQSVVVTLDSSTTGGLACMAYRAVDGAVSGAGGTHTGSSGTADVSLTVTAGSAAIAMVWGGWSVTNLTLSGVTENAESQISTFSGERLACGTASGLSAGTESVTATFTGTLGQFLGCSICVEPA